MKKNYVLTALIAILALSATYFIGCAANEDRNPKTETVEENIQMAKSEIPGPVVEIKTTLGDITVKLYNDTPLHRDNFLKLVKDGYYEGVLFHRVINNFMVQTGDPDSKEAPAGQMLGSGGPGYTIEAEIDYPKHYHKYGALAAARTGDAMNPERRSSGSQFYIVTGNKYQPQQIDMLAQQSAMPKRQELFNRLASEYADSINRMQQAGDHEGLEKLRQELIKKVENEIPAAGLDPAIAADYTSIGGAPHLDGQYTVFGEVLQGMDVVEKIQKVETDRNDRPLEDVKILSVKVVEE